MAESRTTRTMHLPYSTTAWALFQAAFPLTEEEWTQLMAVLDAMKPGLVTPRDETTDPMADRAASNPRTVPGDVQKRDTA